MILREKRDRALAIKQVRPRSHSALLLLCSTCSCFSSCSFRHAPASLSSLPSLPSRGTRTPPRLTGPCCCFAVLQNPLQAKKENEWLISKFKDEERQRNKLARDVVRNRADDFKNRQVSCHGLQLQSLWEKATLQL